MSRRHGAVLERAIASAVMAEMQDKGYAGVTFERVAERAGTSKPVLYRRWSTRAQMVLAAVMTTSTDVVVTPDHGDLAEDLKALLHAMRDNFGSGRAAMLGLLAELDEGSAATISELISRWGAHLVEPAIDNARRRDELGPGDIPDSVMALPFDLGRHELAIRGDLPAERIDVIIDELVVPLLRMYSRPAS